jgi:hypothetical protein
MRPARCHSPCTTRRSPRKIRRSANYLISLALVRTPAHSSDWVTKRSESVNLGIARGSREVAWAGAGPAGDDGRAHRQFGSATSTSLPSGQVSAVRPPLRSRPGCRVGAGLSQPAAVGASCWESVFWSAVLIRALHGAHTCTADTGDQSAAQRLAVLLGERGDIEAPAGALRLVQVHLGGRRRSASTRRGC